MVLELPTTTASTRLELIGLLFSVLPKKNGTPIAMCFASIFSFVFVALLAIAFYTDNWTYFGRTSKNQLLSSKNLAF